MLISHRFLRSNTHRLHHSKIVCNFSFQCFPFSHPLCIIRRFSRHTSRAPLQTRKKKEHFIFFKTCPIIFLKVLKFISGQFRRFTNLFDCISLESDQVLENDECQHQILTEMSDSFSRVAENVNIDRIILPEL